MKEIDEQVSLSELDVLQSNALKTSSDHVKVLRGQNELAQSTSATIQYQKDFNDKLQELKNAIENNMSSYIDQIDFGDNSVRQLELGLNMVQNRMESIRNRVANIVQNLNTMKGWIETIQNGGSSNG